MDPINMGIGEPQHPTPQLIKDALVANFGGLGKYPPTGGTPELRSSIATWHKRRYDVELDPEKEVIPVSGTREALFSFGQAVLDSSTKPVVLMPNPFYQIYEGSALLNGAEPFYVPTPEGNKFLPDWSAVPKDIWSRVQLAFVCSPGNPTGAVIDIEGWKEIFNLAETYGFIIAADECYSEIYNSEPPIGALEAAKACGRGCEKLITFNSLSKRSSCPGLRSGFIAGDPNVIAKLQLYRSYHGASPSVMVQQASVTAWGDELHVRENREKYRAKFDQARRFAEGDDFPLEFGIPEAGFFLWARIKKGGEEEFTRELYSKAGVTVLPGSYLARDVSGNNPGRDYVRIALVADLKTCEEALERIGHVFQRA